jgi:L-arabinokinase
MVKAGELMVRSHESYSENCNLGSEETDYLVEQVMERGPTRGLFGAKITGGGSGGTVAVLMRDRPEAFQVLEEVRVVYEKEYGFRPRLFTGSSPGAMDWPTVQGSL